MALGHHIKKQFTYHVNSLSRHYEVDLFRCLIDSFLSLSDYTVGEIHGRKRQVEYNETKRWFTKRPRCELGDVAIIAFSKKKASGRLIIIQNKVSRNSMRQLCANCQEIGADIVQHELLCERPDFSFTTGKCAGQPNGLIRTSPYPSVCQYGLFYKDIHGNIDMSCITASEFLFSSSALARFPISTRNLRVKIIFTGTFENATSRSSKGDFIAAENLTDFGDLLEDLYIGKPIDLWMKKQVSDMLMVKLSAGEIDISTKKAVDEFIITDFNEDIFSSQDKIYQDDEASNLLNICRTLLLINVDGHAFQKL